MKQEYVVTAKNLCKEFDGRGIINHLNMQVGQGEIYGILGANGAGKTTLLKLIAGLLKPTEGGVSVVGSQPWAERNAVLADIGCLIETPVFYEQLTAEENLSIHLSYMNVRANSCEILKWVGLGAVGKKPVSKFSLGMRQRLGIARSFVHRPKVLLLDEPLNGLDPVAIREMRELFLTLKEEGTTILLSSHILTEVAQTAEKVAIISQGSMVVEADMSQVMREHQDDWEDYFITQMRGGKIL